MIHLNDDEIMGTDKSFMKRRKNNLMLSDNDIMILSSNGIDYLRYQSLEELLFAISEVENETEDERLEELSIKLGEYNYYNYTNK